MNKRLRKVAARRKAKDVPLKKASPLLIWKATAILITPKREKQLGLKARPKTTRAPQSVCTNTARTPQRRGNQVIPTSAIELPILFQRVAPVTAPTAPAVYHDTCLYTSNIQHNVDSRMSLSLSF